jgi:hypothetical protein
MVEDAEIGKGVSDVRSVGRSKVYTSSNGSSSIEGRQPMMLESPTRTVRFRGVRFIVHWLRLKVSRSSASSQSNVVFICGFNPSSEQALMK